MGHPMTTDQKNAIHSFLCTAEDRVNGFRSIHPERTETDGPAIVLILADTQLESQSHALLLKMLAAISLEPGENCELASCGQLTKEEILSRRVACILVLGEEALISLLGKKSPFPEIRGKPFTIGAVPALATFHPAQILSNPELKRPVWEDLKLFKSLIDGNRVN